VAIILQYHQAAAVVVAEEDSFLLQQLAVQVVVAAVVETHVQIQIFQIPTAMTACVNKQISNEDTVDVLETDQILENVCLQQAHVTPLYNHILMVQKRANIVLIHDVKNTLLLLADHAVFVKSVQKAEVSKTALQSVHVTTQAKLKVLMKLCA
jgi:hypothetical protein